jgi:hypothetical protein
MVLDHIISKKFKIKLGDIEIGLDGQEQGSIPCQLKTSRKDSQGVPSHDVLRPGTL